MRVAFTTFGCKINQYETDLMGRTLAASGNAVVPFDDEADVYVINTCSVTAKSDYQCRQAIRSAVKRGQGARIVVTGCYAETRPEELRNIPGVDAVIGNSGKEKLADYLLKSTGLPSAEASRSQGQATAVRSRTRGFLKIQDGCDNQCSYCIVPFARGRSRSVLPEEVMREFDGLVRSGCPEVVLSGIHIGRYGFDIQPRTELTDLIKILIAQRGRTRIRLSSIEPREITRGIIELLGHGLCRHLHIPLQSGDDSILKAMKRDYTSRFYVELVEDITRTVPGTALGADVMIGFPGEGDGEFNNTVRLIENSPLTHLHVFSYSPRPGTPAATMPEQAPEQVKKERSSVLRALGRKKNFHFRRAFLGSELNVVIEDKPDRETDSPTGLTDNYIRVKVSGAQQSQSGKEIPVRIAEVTENETIGVFSGNY